MGGGKKTLEVYILLELPKLEGLHAQQDGDLKQESNVKAMLECARPSRMPATAGRNPRPLNPKL